MYFLTIIQIELLFNEEKPDLNENEEKLTSLS